MEFIDSEYLRIEKILLSGGSLNSRQKEFVKLLESKIIIAGPGSGKTTSLSLKIALFLSYINRNNIPDGICVITHTNVAVNEINNALEKVGVGKLRHPHFIGTIHEFFNSYCVIPYFKRYYKNTSFFFAKEHDNLDAFVSILSRSFSWMQPGVKKSIAERAEKSRLILNETTKVFDLENTSDWDIEKFENHKRKMIDIKIKRKSQGYLTFDETFLFSKACLFDNRVVEMLRARFKYVFIDEYQDTHKDGEALIDMIFNSPDCILQKIGDPFQTIGYGQSMPIIQEDEVFRLNLSVRFGKELANHLNIIVPEAKIITDPNKASFKPVIFKYNNQKEISTAYIKYIDSLEGMNYTFDKSEHVDSILVLRKVSSEHYLNEVYIKSSKDIKEPLLITVKKIIVDFIHKKISSSNQVNAIDSHLLKLIINKHEQISEVKLIILILIKNIEQQDALKLIRNCINNVLEEYGINGINVTNSVIIQIKTLIEHHIKMAPVEVQYLEKLTRANIRTIHSVKGETHRSVLLLDELENKTLTKIFLNQYSEDQSIIPYSEEEIINRNLLYVAMSRPTHLFVFAINQAELTPELIQKFEGLGWDIVET
ncbi:hypothetical protein BC351_40340 [Paenibacillus ferrarius]|uniref:UvrD-like helicase ATP-binding domain-containing protein n=1 Tax=Paenibacillus ferrarius TaxID=1469647 RepID=A0A1V4H822_9BACL|nr:UvrD-helicase domain-containing protein [Paenibacillus ferrarius]OPH47339.1 hypothetical protein BC351_40340 [Paenibacillus ferrarius]